DKAPVLIVSHGAGDQKDDYLEMAQYLAERGISSLLVDMHGHGASGGQRYHVTMREWVADIIAAVDYLETRGDVDPGRIGALGISSGGTAVLEAALIDPRLKVLIPLDATVMNTLPLGTSLTMRVLSAVGYVKRFFTGEDLRISVLSMLDDVSLASDPEINARLKVDPRKVKSLSSLPLPGAAEAFFVNTIQRVPQIKVPTLVVWGEDDELDPITTAHALHKALTCTKGIEIIPGNGHAGHVDRNRRLLFEVVAKWLLKHLA
ncbi:MAG: alpha/beta fold hydrolase, partial [Prosthecobacter sp.]|nr:alpha/beta fold hydrolase [Prosthecobacter sp.]